MPRPRNIDYDLKRRMELILKARLKTPADSEAFSKKNCDNDEDEPIAPLNERIAVILGLVRQKPKKTPTMNYLIMYDIADHKVRNHVAKYLKKKGCLRIQKSVFMLNSSHQAFENICETLRAVNEVYENKDSIILVPVNVSDVRSMKLIGYNVNIEVLIDPPSTLFF